MKKLFLASVFTLVGLTAFAQESEIAMISTEVIEDTQDNFSEIMAEALPQAVVEAVAKDFGTATINKAYVNEEMQYKLELSSEDGSASTVYADEEGNWIEL
ncbi:hypothetical protein H0I23_12545 [Cellulophaga sp. HaHaR_3_176]|uniref:hypothetical protein n=1 Tax=Cellulophaga sp. HaHaR_3_176 TaxID=1942464 RepID=UPI001C1F3D43|nr:hypothetical protein [Cellulophaga sp. HaHaR_3_176]QWX83275.1 hypothetical protein H0I23_12545 [Cellulophaga sp. HaHaR_3_176]